MDKKCIGMSEEEYKEFRERRNISNRKYYSKPKTKTRVKIYRKEYDKKNIKNIRAREKAYRENPEKKARHNKMVSQEGFK